MRREIDYYFGEKALAQFRGGDGWYEVPKMRLYYGSSIH